MGLLVCVWGYICSSCTTAQAPAASMRSTARGATADVMDVHQAPPRNRLATRLDRAPPCGPQRTPTETLGGVSGYPGHCSRVDTTTCGRTRREARVRAGGHPSTVSFKFPVLGLLASNTTDVTPQSRVRVCATLRAAPRTESARFSPAAAPLVRVSRKSHARALVSRPHGPRTCLGGSRRTTCVGYDLFRTCDIAFSWTFVRRRRIAPSEAERR